MEFRGLARIATLCLVAVLWNGSASVCAAGTDVFAELGEIPITPDQPIDLSGPPLSVAHLRAVYSIDQFGHEEMTVFARRRPSWSVIRDRDVANYTQFFSEFGPATQNYNIKIERALTVEIGHLTINTKGIFLWY